MSTPKREPVAGRKRELICKRIAAGSFRYSVGKEGVEPSVSSFLKITDAILRINPFPRKISVGDRGIEPRTSRSRTERSADELVSDILRGNDAWYRSTTPRDCLSEIESFNFVPQLHSELLSGRAWIRTVPLEGVEPPFYP